jgi:TRAP transporter TAXI family solute receptor
MNRWIFAAIAALGGVIVGSVVATSMASKPLEPFDPRKADAEILVGGGWVTGVYYAVAGSICLHSSAQAGMGGQAHCAVEPSGGSLENIERLREGATTFALAQSDWQFHAYHGTALFSEQGPFDGLRSVMALHAEPVTVLAKQESGAASLSDLKGARIYAGNSGSGARATWDVVAAAEGWSDADRANLAEGSLDQAFQDFCAGTLDALVLVVGHPSSITSDAILRCGAVLLPVAGAAIDALVEENPYFRSVTIAAGTYPGQDDAVESFGVGATLVTRADVSDDLVADLVSAVLEDFDSFTGIHPALSGLTPSELASAGLSAPLHPGAERAYEKGGLK